jgi:transposase InsO family protein
VLHTRAYRPQTNGKAERFIQTLLREWAYARPFKHSRLRTRALNPWLRYYNQRRPHGSLDGKPPISRLRARREQRP